VDFYVSGSEGKKQKEESDVEGTWPDLFDQLIQVSKNNSSVLVSELSCEKYQTSEAEKPAVKRNKIDSEKTQ